MFTQILRDVIHFIAHAKGVTIFTREYIDAVFSCACRIISYYEMSGSICLMFNQTLVNREKP